MSGQEKLEAAGHTASAVRKQREMDAGAWPSFSSYCCLADIDVGVLLLTWGLHQSGDSNKRHGFTEFLDEIHYQAGLLWKVHWKVSAHSLALSCLPPPLGILG